MPLRVQPAYVAGWQTLAGDPGPSLGLPATVDDADDDTLALRERVLADVQEHYYARPPRIERGWREFLVDTDGRVYLDMVNNVTSVGHAHPRVVEAAHRQMRLLNTNSRFNYRAVAEFAERISATLPDELDTVFFVNSGSEATDLAIRIAMAATGRTDIVAMREAYHGWTFASDAVSTSIADNPNALATRPHWVHTVDAANSVSRSAPRPRRRPLRNRGRAGHRRPGGRGNASRRLHLRVRTSATPAASRSPTATWHRCTPQCAGTAASRSPTRCRSATAGSANGSGVSSSSRPSPTWWPSRSPWAAGNRSVSSSRVATSPSATARGDTSSPRRVAHRSRRRSASPCST